MSDDESAEAGRHTAQAFKSMLAAALVLADARRQRQIQEMRWLESQANGREQDAHRRETTDTMLVGPPERTAAPATAGAALEDPVSLAERWAAAQQPGTDETNRVDLDTQVKAGGVDPDQVRAAHAATVAAGSSSEATLAGRTTDTVLQQGVWQDGSPEVAKAGLSYTRRPGSMITPGLSPQRRPRQAVRTADRTWDLGR